MKECGELGPASQAYMEGLTKEESILLHVPGGYVVNASSEPGRLAVNGMSYHDRAGEKCQQRHYCCSHAGRFLRDGD